jgi:hypothetical protein
LRGGPGTGSSRFIISVSRRSASRQSASAVSTVTAANRSELPGRRRLTTAQQYQPIFKAAVSSHSPIRTGRGSVLVVLVENNGAASGIGSTSSKSFLRGFEECRAALIR